MLTQNQQTVYNWINDDLELPVYAEAYKGAIEQLNNKLSGYITFVSHAGRDLMNSLAPTINGVKRQQVQYVQLINDFQDEWKDEWGEEGFNTTETNDENGHLIPDGICKKIKKLIDDHKEGRLRAEEIDSSFLPLFWIILIKKVFRRTYLRNGGAPEIGLLVMPTYVRMSFL